MPHLASRILGGVAGRINDHWLKKYGHTIYLLEAFVAGIASGASVIRRPTGFVWGKLKAVATMTSRPQSAHERHLPLLSSS
jgi:hypothetical protein